MGDVNIYDDVNEICNATECHLNKQRIRETFRNKCSRKGILVTFTSFLMCCPFMLTVISVINLGRKKFLKIFLISFHSVNYRLCNANHTAYYCTCIGNFFDC